jgi:hypothetical protein
VCAVCGDSWRHLSAAESAGRHRTSMTFEQDRATEAQIVARRALSGAWGAAAAALREDWEGFEVLIQDGVVDAQDACAWAMAAIGGVNAILRHWDMSTTEWGDTIMSANNGAMSDTIEQLLHQIRTQGGGAVVGRTVGQLAVAVKVAALHLSEDPDRLMRRLCLDVQTIK